MKASQVMSCSLSSRRPLAFNAQHTAESVLLPFLSTASLIPGDQYHPFSESKPSSGGSCHQITVAHHRTSQDQQFSRPLMGFLIRQETKIKKKKSNTPFCAGGAAALAWTTLLQATFYRLGRSRERTTHSFEANKAQSIITSGSVSQSNQPQSTKCPPPGRGCWKPACPCGADGTTEQSSR